MGKKRILITGMSGFLGSTLERVLKDEGYDVFGFDADISDTEAVENYNVGTEKVDWIIHAAAIVNVDTCEKDKPLCYRVNVEGTKNIRDLAERIGARILYTSTIAVFSEKEGSHGEHDIPYPSNFYGLVKLLGEQAILEYSLGLVLRINLMGIHPMGSRGQTLIEWVVDSIDGNKDIQLFSDIMVNPLSNWTVAEFIGKIIDLNPKEKILHLGSSDIVSKADIGKLVIKRFGGYKGNVKIVSADSVEGRVARSKQMWIDTKYTQKKLNLTMPSVESEIEKIFKIYSHKT